MLLIFIHLFVLSSISSCLAQSSPISSVEKEHEIKKTVAAYDLLVDNKYSFFMHKRSFLMPFSYNRTANESIYAGLPDYNQRGGGYYNRTEAEFQISVFLPITRKLFDTSWDLMFAYTHHAWWQLYNNKWSKPFRETNYTPELFLRKVDSTPADIFGFKLVAMDFGFTHQSNGQYQLLSRSWDRVFSRVNLTKESAVISLMLWYRVPEKAIDDDNRTILRYMGIGEISLHKSIDDHSVELTLPIAERPGAHLEYSYPWYENYRWFASFHYGYGSSLIEYDRSVQRIALGITLESFMDRKKSN